MEISTLIWIMGIIGILFLFFKTFIRFEVRDVDDYISDGNVPTKAKDKAIAKTLKNLIESTNNNVEQIDNITRYMNTQEKINKSTDKVLRSLVLKLKQVTDENIRNSKK